MWNKNQFKFKSWVSRLILFIVTLIVPLIIHGCIFQQNNALKTFRVGINNWPGFDIVLYAQETGMFKNRGLEVELVRFQNGSDAARAMLRGSVDAAFGSLWEVKQIDPGNDKPIFVLVTNISAGSDGIVTQPNFKSVEDLKGKKVGAKLGTVNHLILLEALKLYDLKPTDVEIDNISNQAAAQKMQKSLLDAAVIWEPLLSNTAQNIQGNIVYTTKDLDSLVIDGLVTRSETLDNKEEELTRFIVTWFDLMEVVDNKSNEVFEIVSQQLDQTPESFAQDYAGLKKGDIAMNRRMFKNQGRLSEILPQLTALLQEDLRHGRIIRDDVEINGEAVMKALEKWQPKT
ncbi:ABC-type nitrate/sulfonate/bicarbonate transport system, periplasmic component [Xenococcus sp. PCC 7305]|uniref:ABC transporter substrate-binding protein n=1 Tax=Xenococcus sp. PCC 7305 TaxID=102125 RepID=UPI0002ACCC24|nr:ABC transporter substrate-binding protein [Xenococcus sp. PCC 7305]ELS04711.1 ABC-type nitrate/sulfonate/bicarbonate transport system, periplasmic component [Xenococcus sp. PCC 7305]